MVAVRVRRVGVSVLVLMFALFSGPALMTARADVYPLDVPREAASIADDLLAVSQAVDAMSALPGVSDSDARVIREAQVAVDASQLLGRSLTDAQQPLSMGPMAAAPALTSDELIYVADGIARVRAGGSSSSVFYDGEYRSFSASWGICYAWNYPKGVFLSIQGGRGYRKVPPFAFNATQSRLSVPAEQAIVELYARMVAAPSSGRQFYSEYPGVSYLVHACPSSALYVGEGTYEQAVASLYGGSGGGGVTKAEVQSIIDAQNTTTSQMIAVMSASQTAQINALGAVVSQMQTQVLGAVNQLAASQTDMSPLVDAWGSVPCATPRTNSWWTALGPNPTGQQIWSSSESKCGIQRGDLRDLAERIYGGLKDLKPTATPSFSDKPVKEAVDRVESAVRALSDRLAQKMTEVLDGVTERINSLKSVAERQAAAAEQSASKLGTIAAWLTSSQMPITPGDGPITDGGAVQDSKDRVSEWFGPAECVVNSAIANQGTSSCGGGPVLSIPIPGADPVQWRPFSWCMSTQAFTFARDVAGWSLIFMAGLGFIRSVLGGIGYSVHFGANQHIAAVKAEQKGS